MKDYSTRLDTLAQSGTSKFTNPSAELVVSGNGTDIVGNPALTKRAKRKVISQRMNLALIDIAKSKGRNERIKGYWNTYHCLKTVFTSNGKMYSSYCKNRFCTVCCAIRKAEIINKYHPVLNTWNEAYFVTLTVKSCNAKNLYKWITGMFRAFELIHWRCKKRYQRSTGIKLMGVKSLECNFNPINKTYNPHFHIIVPNEAIANLLKAEWLKQWKSDKTLFTSAKAQHSRKVEDLEHDLIEIIKYGSKIFTEPDLKKKGNSSIPPTIYVKALDNILTAMKGKRIFDRFGFNLPKESASKTTFTWLSNYEKWSFSEKHTDWINKATGEGLTGYKKPSELAFLLNNCINSDLQ
ncbi:MAG: hypothetical protein COA58_08435 [Bacteroidetes bacterium]|nr:MAG: hypothetical protein COA58_08435 [Bacteroidota bacterium]